MSAPENADRGTQRSDEGGGEGGDAGCDVPYFIMSSLDFIISTSFTFFPSAPST